MEEKLFVLEVTNMRGDRDMKQSEMRNGKEEGQQCKTLQRK